MTPLYLYTDSLKFRAVQKAVVHGSRHSCDGSRFPPIFVRLDNYEVLSWINEVAFPGRPPVQKPQGPAPSTPEIPQVDPPRLPTRTQPPIIPGHGKISFDTPSRSTQGGKYINDLFAFKKASFRT